MKTLIIADVQYDFLPGGSLEVPDGDVIIPVINQIQKSFELVIATQDWHPANHISFASNHKHKKPFDEIKLDGKPQILWPDHCVQNTRGASFHQDLKLTRAEAIIRKGMDRNIDSYSGFYDNNHEKSTGLTGYLRDRNAENLFFCGLAADFCVWYSILDAHREGFSVTLIEDATKPINTKEFDKIKHKMKKMGISIIESGELG